MAKRNQTEDQTVDQEVETEVKVDAVKVAIQEAFTKGVESGAEEDDVKMAMVQAGATFKNVARLFSGFMVDAGLAISPADRATIVSEALEGAELSTEEAFDAAVAVLVEKVVGATERSAASLIRAYCKKNDLECYAKPKSAGGGGRSGFASTFYDYLIANPGATADEAKAFVMGEGDHADTSDNVKKHLSHYMGIHGLVAKIVAS